jgi:colanic acid biosynthesis protein WcaH
MNEKIPKELYENILENSIIVDVDAVIHNENKALLVYRIQEPAKNQWWIPGGRQKKLEFGEESVISKVKEETGLDVEVEKLIGVYEERFDTTPFPNVKTGGHHLIRAYLVNPINKNQKIKLDETSEDYKWIDKIDENLDNYVKRILLDSGIFEK